MVDFHFAVVDVALDVTSRSIVSASLWGIPRFHTLEVCVGEAFVFVGGSVRLGVGTGVLVDAAGSVCWCCACVG